MKKVIIASNNLHKIEEINSILNIHGFLGVTLKEAGLENFEIEETGTTFEENSMIKAKAVFDKLGLPTLADDTGLMVDILKGEPGVYSARYASANATYQENNKKLLLNLEGIPFLERKAKFVTVITMILSNEISIVTRGEISGYIALEPAGENGFGYDPLFYVEENSKTFAQMDNESKNRISHRARALGALNEQLSKRSY
jgi:XTP/dITP diphosphohydrolase